MLRISSAPTAQIFHIVDQLSQWDVYTHDQYARWAKNTQLLDEGDRGLLREHAEMRRKRGWGHGFEAAFLVDESIENAAAEAVGAGSLSEAEARRERDILLHFAPKLQGLLESRQASIDSFVHQLQADKERLKPLVLQLAHFADVGKPPVVPVFLIANVDEHNGGGGAESGRLVVEVPLADAAGTLLHEAMHRLLDIQQQRINAAADAIALGHTELNEGIAYALYPGILAENSGGDRLMEELVRLEWRGTSATNPAVRFHLVAAILRPMLKDALGGKETIASFLPRVVAKWRALGLH